MDEVSKREKDMIKRKLKNLSKEEKISFFKDMFIEHTQTGSRYIHSNPNGFMALGVFKTPQDHIIEKVNTMWLFGVGVGKTEDEIIPIEDAPMTIVEVEEFIQVLTEGLKKAKELGVKRTNIESVGEPEIREERKIEMNVIDAKDHKKMYKEIINLFEKYGFSVDEAVPHLHALKEIILGVLKEKYGLEGYEMYELDDS